jgi:OCT family organic cation transporter-like MFS transporter 18
MLYASKLPGIGMAGFLCAQTAVSRITEGEERIVALGRLTTSYTVGGVIGPYLGGILGSTGDYYVGAKAATIGSLLACLVVYSLPAAVDDVTNDSKGKGGDKKDKGSENKASVPWFSRAKIVLSAVGLLLFIKVLTLFRTHSFAHTLSHTHSHTLSHAHSLTHSLTRYSVPRRWPPPSRTPWPLQLSR